MPAFIVVLGDVEIDGDSISGDRWEELEEVVAPSRDLGHRPLRSSIVLKRVNARRGTWR